MARKKKASADKENQDPGAAERCNWTDADDTVLLKTLEAEKIAGNQSESGWKSTVWNACAAALAKAGVGDGPTKTGAKCRDHYQSKLKAEWTILQELLGSAGASGFGWDDGMKCVTASEEVWNAKCAKTKRYNRFRGKPYPHYDVMKYLIDGVVATGAGAFNPGESPQSSPVRPRERSTSPTEYDRGDPTSDEVDGPVISSSPPPPSTKSRKRERADSDSSPSSSAASRTRHRPSQRVKKEEGLDRIGKGLEAIASGLEASQDVDYQVKAVELLEDDAQLSEDDMTDVLYLFGQNDSWAKMYCTLRTAARRTSFAKGLVLKNQS